MIEKNMQDLPGIQSIDQMYVRKEKMPDTIMVIEDDNVIRDMMCIMIKRDRPSINIIEGENGQDAFGKMTCEIKLIFTDNFMPLLNGIEFIRKIKSCPEYCHIPVVMVTAENRVAFKMITMELGVNGLVIKPFHVIEIREYLNKYL